MGGVGLSVSTVINGINWSQVLEGVIVIVGIYLGLAVILTITLLVWKKLKWPVGRLLEFFQDDADSDGKKSLSVTRYAMVLIITAFVNWVSYIVYCKQWDQIPWILIGALVLGLYHLNTTDYTAILSRKISGLGSAQAPETGDKENK